jgi:probable F420-dependent oxidoreductase
MKFGIVTFPTDYSAAPAPLARAAEERGFESLFFPEHTHIPVSRRTPWPGGAELPREYSHILDPFVGLTAAAAVTTKILLGAGICLVTEHDPISTAKTVASLDLISNGRFLFGIGAGWNVEEMENHGADPNHRWKIVRERVQAMKEIWTKEEAEYHGEFVNFDPIWSWPKPVQKPHPPVLIGGDSPHTLKRVIAYGDGWMPIPFRNPAPLSERIQELNRMAAEAGRGRIPVTVYGAQPREEVLNHYAEIGVDRCIFWMPSATEADAMVLLDRYTKLVEQFAAAGAG